VVRILRAIAISFGVLLVAAAVIAAGVRLRETRTSEPVAASSPSPTRPSSPASASLPPAPIASPQRQTAPPPPPAPCPIPFTGTSPRPAPSGVAAIIPIPNGFNERISPDGELLLSGLDPLFLYVLKAGNPSYVACLRGAGAQAGGWFPDSSAVLLSAARSSGGRGVMVLSRDGRLTDTGLDDPPSGRDGVVMTSDGQWLALLQGDALTVASIDGRTRRTIEQIPWQGGFLSGWLDDQHVLYARSDAGGRLTYRLADRSGTTTAAPAVTAKGVGFATLPSPDGRGSVLLATGASSPITVAVRAYDGALADLDIQMIFGWSGPHDLVARHGTELVIVDLRTGAMHTVAGGLDPQLSFPLFSSARGPVPFGAGVADGFVCWHNSGPALSVAELATGRTGSVTGPSTVLGMTADGRCVTTETLAGGYGLVDPRSLLR
jgi:hypothetical protein